ncbi:gamma-glutamyltransferase family protein [Alkalicoccus daliensis]|uniref:Gamma-glutamyltranspeptidase / glutathione hydrolase n=1 Tax=Alkalicoccus daliensis TaxID=745820 RepID=A0A1H0I186_9BACI|nr:gamma-glutamyltransferase [Alkalicoccus daliensis]SDO25227.1 gamma-glutamyltranspeptidase / glutathione hydrolase [Alkalicoccus daliensis]
MNYKPYLKWTHISAAVIFVGLIAWNFYFAEEFDPYREPYSGADFQDRQVDTVEVDPSEENTGGNDGNNAGNEESDPSINVYGVSSIHPLAADVGMEIMENGGNAVDAAVAISFMLGVVEPYGSGIGGGGLMMVHDPEDGALSYDYREAAAASGAWPERGVAVPGLVKGMESAHEDYGTLSWEELLEPAVTTAREGFQVGQIFNETTGNAARRLELTDQERELFFPGGQTLEVNETLVQEELADTLELIQSQGAAGFYEGPVAEALTSEVGYGQQFTEEDLASYQSYVRDTVSADIGELTVHGGPSPSSGAVTVQVLQMADRLESDGLMEMTMEELTNNPEHEHLYMHLVNEMTKVAYESRLDTLGDPEFEDISHEELTSDDYIAGLMENISFDQVNDSEIDLFDSPAETADARHTTHFVIVDQEGRMVSATHSLGEFYGSGWYTNGFFLNNQLTNFSDNEESPNYYEAGKRPRTFVSPMIFEENDRAVLGLGSPGGRRIPAMVLQTYLRYQYGLNDNNEEMTLQEAIEYPRFYNEDDVIYVEDDDFDPEAGEQLRQMRYSVVVHTSPLFYGGIQGLGLVTDEEGNVSSMYGGGDPRRNGAWQIETAD